MPDHCSASATVLPVLPHGLYCMYRVYRTPSLHPPSTSATSTLAPLVHPVPPVPHPQYAPKPAHRTYPPVLPHPSVYCLCTACCTARWRVRCSWRTPSWRSWQCWGSWWGARGAATRLASHAWRRAWPSCSRTAAHSPAAGEPLLFVFLDAHSIGVLCLY